MRGGVDLNHRPLGYETKVALPCHFSKLQPSVGKRATLSLALLASRSQRSWRMFHPWTGQKPAHLGVNPFRLIATLTGRRWGELVRHLAQFPRR